MSRRSDGQRAVRDGPRGRRAGRAVARHDPALLPRGQDPGPPAARARSGRCGSCGARSRRRSTGSPSRPQQAERRVDGRSEACGVTRAARTDLPQAERAVGDPLPRRARRSSAADGLPDEGRGARGAGGGAAPGAARAAVPAEGDAARADGRVPGAVRGGAVDGGVADGQHASRRSSTSATSRSASCRSQQIGAWRASLPEGKRYRVAPGAAAGAAGGGAVEVDRGQPGGAGQEPEPEAGRDRSVRDLGLRSTRSPPSSTTCTRRSWSFLAGTGVRPEEAFGAEWRDVDLRASRVHGAPRVREGSAEGVSARRRGSRRAVPMRARVVAALEACRKRRGILFPAPEGGRIDINNFRNRLVDAVARGRRRRAPADLRPAAHVRDVEPGGRRRHLHAGAADGHEREDDRPDLRPPGRRARTTTSASCSTRLTPARPLDALWTRRRPKCRPSAICAVPRCRMSAGLRDEWAVAGSNRGPPACKAGALTS